ncbi:hypothetical protein [Spirosoma sp.]|uniref:hypothetical protein n=1 Tax=Spirosoma sp. TaxID=1899569 RepID=UPI00261486CB|nr:hypothetical protein [Spirosoma sp.]
MFTKRFNIIIALVVASLIIYKLRWGYESFDVSDPTKRSTYSYKRKWPNGNYHSLRLKVKGELKNGVAYIKVYQCRLDPKDTYGILTLEIRGKVDTMISNQYYRGEACIVYKPHNVEGGKLTISIAAK